MSNNEKISVIVPIYNTEKYLRKCVDSVLAQTYCDLEIILVNDGSPDHSLSICREYEKQDARIKVVDKPNGGLSNARNAGLEEASGAYITFVDSDDYLDKGAYAALYHELVESQADIALMQIVFVDEFYHIITQSVSTVSENIIENSNWFLQKICERQISCSVWDKLFRRELFINRKFDENRLNEDFLLLSDILLEDVKIAITNYYGYYYYTRSNSLSRSGFSKSIVDAVYNTVYVKELAQLKAPEIVAYVAAYAVYQARTALILMPYKMYKADQKFVMFCMKVIHDNRQYIAHSFMGSKDKLFCYLYLACPSVTKLFGWLYRKNKS